MTNRHFPLLLTFSCSILFMSLAQAQQNSDIAVLSGPAFGTSHAISGSTDTVSGGTGLTTSICFGYQVVRKSAASLWVEVLPGVYPSPENRSVNTGVHLSEDARMYSAGMRLMIPLQSRVSLFTAAGGGLGNFHQATPTLKLTSALHGLVEFGGGVDVRLTRRFSIRVDVRDYVSGRGLGGVAGRHRLLPLAGIALHI